jgi:predicted amidohydrolase YtcJ
MMVDHGLIAWIGTDDAAMAFVDGADQAIDLHGALVTPAFVDAHVHTTSTGLALIGLDLSAVRSAGELLDAVAGYGANHPDSVVRGSGWDDSCWTDPRLPTAAELDRAAAGRAVYLPRVDAHSALVSTALLTDAVRVRPGFSATGLLRREAHDRVRAGLVLSDHDRGQAQRAALLRAARLGIASVHEMAGPAISNAADLVSVLALSAAPSGPGVEVIGYWAELGATALARDLGAAGAAGDLFCDGSFGSHTAALHQPYADLAGPAPQPRLTATEVAQHFLGCTRSGLQAGFHAIGDAAVDAVLDGLEQAAAADPGVRTSGHRIEHAELVRDPDRLGRSGLVASVQPAFDARWGGPIGMYADRLGPQRAAGTNDLSALSAAGVALAFGSDSPVTPLDPWGTVRAAAYPKFRSSGISVRAAFAAHTRGGWRAARRDGDGSGVLAVGNPATYAVWDTEDLVIDVPDERVARWSTDPRAGLAGLPDVSPGQPLPRCRRTVVRGRVIFDAETG